MRRGATKAEKTKRLLEEIREKSRQYCIVPPMQLTESQRKMLLDHYKKNLHKYVAVFEEQKIAYAEYDKTKSRTRDEQEKYRTADRAVMEFRVIEGLLGIKNKIGLVKVEIDKKTGEVREV